MECRPSSRLERTGPIMTYTNTRSADIGLDEDRGHSPVRPLTEHYIMKRAINHWTHPKHPSYNLSEARLDFFKNWPRGSPSPESLSEAGFFFNGTYIFTKFWITVFSVYQIFVSLIPENFVITGRSDETFCFHCGIGTHEWLPSDNAWQEHARWSPYCVYVRYIRGPTFVHENKWLGSSQERDWKEDVLVTCNMMRLIKLGYREKNPLLIYACWYIELKPTST